MSITERLDEKIIIQGSLLMTKTSTQPTLSTEQISKDIDRLIAGDIETLKHIESARAIPGKISDLLNTSVSYTPPELLTIDSSDYQFLLKHFNADQAAIVMKTLFQFEQQDINGLLLVMTNHDSVKWLKNALHEFINAYEG